MKTSDIAKRAVRLGGQKALEFFTKRDQLTIHVKGPQDYVSEADRTVEAIMIDFLQSHFPDDGFLGEESSEIKQARQWVIDPLMEQPTLFADSLIFVPLWHWLRMNESLAGF